MTDQVLKPVLNGSGSSFEDTGGSTHRLAFDGKSAPESGAKLPVSDTPVRNLAQLAQEMNVASRNLGRELRFQVDLKLGYAVIEVLDRETGEVIRQIPPEEAALAFGRDGSANLRILDAVV